MSMRFSVRTPASRLTATVYDLCEFLDDPRCRSCEVLEICLKRLRDDVLNQRSTMPKEVCRKLRQVVPFAASHRRCDGQRCLPAEMLMVYLTYSHESAPAREANISVPDENL